MGLMMCLEIRQMSPDAFGFCGAQTNELLLFIQRNASAFAESLPPLSMVFILKASPDDMQAGHGWAYGSVGFRWILRSDVVACFLFPLR
jgi:hypothetical protein